MNDKPMPIGTNRPTLRSVRRAIDTATVHGQAQAAPKSPSPFTDPRLEQAYNYWRAKAAARAMPSRADIDPTEIPPT